MFENAIDTASQFTRSLHTITRNYSSATIRKGASTLFFVNDEGWALTCRHVADLLTTQIELDQVKEKFISDRTLLIPTAKQPKSIERDLAKKYGFDGNTNYEIRNYFLNCYDSISDLYIKKHPLYDVALIKFNGYSQLYCNSFPIFSGNGAELKSGKHLCRLGYPFAEFTNFNHDLSTDTIQWNSNGKIDTPIFPIDGMMTRQYVDDTGTVFAFEMSTPGLKGQSGGPAFDKDGIIWGMQYATRHLDLDFDVKEKVIRAGVEKEVTNSPFLHVGLCIHIDILKAFMREQNVNFQER